MQIYTDYDWLYRQYITLNKNAKDIAVDCGVTEMTIYNWLKRFDLLKFKGKGRVLGSRKVKDDLW